MAVELMTIARPYAKALYQLATEKGEVQIWLRELALLAQISKDKQMSSLLQELSLIHISEPTRPY